MGEGWGGGGALVRRTDAKKFADPIKRGIWILKHLSVLKTKDAKSLRNDPFIAFAIALPPQRIIV